MMLGRLFDRRDTGLLLTLVEGPGRGAGRHVPVRTFTGHRRLLARPHAPRSGRAPKRTAGLRPLLDHRPSQGDGHEGSQPELRRLAVGARGRQRRRCHPAGGALGPAPPLRRPSDRDAVALQRQIRAAVAAPLHRVRLGRTVRARRRADHAGRVPDRGTGASAACSPPVSPSGRARPCPKRSWPRQEHAGNGTDAPGKRPGRRRGHERVPLPPLRPSRRAPQSRRQRSLRGLRPLLVRRSSDATARPTTSRPGGAA